MEQKMEPLNLKTASTYINNLLLARGLLRDGKPIEFAHPSRGEGGKEATMAHIINLVHDLILKRDRDQAHRESLASTLRALRSESTRQTSALEKLQTRNEDLARQLSLAQSQERSARAALRTAESSARSLREEMLRLKTTVQQVRTSCANDIRKRDIQIQRLKNHLTGQQRGNRSGLVGASITINPGTMTMNGMGTSRDDALDVDDPEYNLSQDTTEFLTKLSQSLSDENDNLIGLVRSTLVTLKELQGLPIGPRRDENGDLSTVGEEEETVRQNMMHGLPTSYESLAADMDTVLEKLKTLLTNPNFVSVEEVETREEEIAKLRAGWDRMESRWRDTLALMDGWRRKMAGGNTIDLEELKLGLGLGADLGTVTDAEVSVISEDDDDEASSELDEDIDEEVEVEEPLPAEANQVPAKNPRTDMFTLKLQHDRPVLKEANINKSHLKSPRKVAFSASIPNTPSEAGNENAKEIPSKEDRVGSIKRTHMAPSATSSPLDERTSRPASQESRIPRHARKRLSSPHAHPDERSPKLTVNDKLKAAEAEAAAAAEELKSADSAAGRNGGEEAGERKHRSRGSPTKTRISGRPRRRKSTLTPEELQNLLGFE
ncbi:uncharacterized protein EI97DRAFT_432566 [Westerdykella ornata]|uniref:NIMA interactive protein n=1 Tax=Westerdykella ornata TaxID=318751 RepID=A0A6A6JKB1_WESOR|nr:uncharacterized protein EI97DRAFT_432566 [Westerdykella ornata]KAF2276947.1 hypothetical protein EI97DRAFT_432566 [Westerdykella ornata]